MKAGVLFSGGKDSTYAAYLAQKNGIELTCLISLYSENDASYMFHTPSISKVQKQAEAMQIPLIIQHTKGEKEEELIDLQKAIEDAKNKYGIGSIITGAVESAYQASRVQRICDSLNLDCFNPLWQKNQFELLQDILQNSFEVVITGIFCYPLDHTWLGKTIDNQFIEDVTTLHERYKINPAGEGGEFETFVLNCPLFKTPLQIIDRNISGSKHSWSMEVELK